MKSFTVIASSLLLCSCADMVVTKSYVSNSVTRTGVDAKDFDAKETVHYEANCGVGAANPSAIYIRPFCIDSAIFPRGRRDHRRGNAYSQSAHARRFCG